MNGLWSDPQLLGLCLWVVLAFVLAMIPSRDNHWRRAYVLIAIGVPLLVWVTWTGGIWYGVLGLVAGGSFLRWPLFYFWRWIRRKAAR
ncbi:DUF2484 family protein [Yoonia sp.]|uniref:DUF2484 family protein n=1 Tax=Yoonia sp. TaxID=2212373 RepID=UPI0019FAA87F|nr:DUF2484 family protein [Yoonia sp.]MBE0413553.1 DUF2484 family protein [Yoonia sp.]